jgi:acetyltransferase-like isoleucine patch superfamily enzyme
MNAALKGVARGLAFVAISPLLLWFVVKRAVLGPDCVLQGSAQALVPGLPAQYVRRAFLSVAIACCAPTSAVEFGVTFSQSDARLDENVYVGPYCSLGRVHHERDVLVAGGVHIPSGAGAVAARAIPDGSVTVGVRARVIRVRGES